MSKMLIFFIAAFVGVLLLTGIVEIRFSPEKYVDIPNLTNKVFKEKTTFEKGRAKIVSWKRKAELFVIQSKEKRLVLSLLYVKKDAARLNELIAKEVTASTLLPQAEQLIDSIDLVRTNAEKAPVEVVAGMKDESTESFLIAQEALGSLQQQYTQLEEIHGEFDRLTTSLEDQIGQLGLEETKDEEVAGSKDTQSTEQETIPLKF